MWSEDYDFILQVFSQEFKKYFTKDLNTNLQLVIPPSADISDQDNAWLTRGTTMEEVRQAGKQIGPLKAPGPDGMHVIFYDKTLSVTSKSIFNMIRAFLHHGVILK